MREHISWVGDRDNVSVYGQIRARFSSSIVSMISGPEIPTGVHPVIPVSSMHDSSIATEADIVCEMPTEQRISLCPEKHPFTLCYRTKPWEIRSKIHFAGKQSSKQGFILDAVFEFLYPGWPWRTLLV